MMTDNDRAWAAGGILGGVGLVLAGGAWAGAAAGALVTGERTVPLTPVTVYRMVTDWSGTWSASPTASLIGALAVNLTLLVLVVWGIRWALRWYRNPSGLATLVQLRELTPRTAGATAQRLRPGLAKMKPREVAPADRGVLLGNHLPTRVELRGSDEDTYTALMAPRAGKSTALAIPIAEEAPAALLMTSNKPDVYAATLRSRGRAGTCWTLDTQGVAQAERDMWWDMIAQAETYEGAERLAGHFVTQITNDAADPFWSQAASDVLVGMFRAAWRDGGTVREVMRWLADPDEKAPMHILHQHDPELAHQVEASVNIYPETRDGIYQNARTAMSSFRDPDVLAWVLPDDQRPQFVPEEFVLSRDSLYLLSKRGGPASAVVAACADAVFTAATEAGERHGGRLPNPMRAVLDEAANICKIADLPDLYSHLGSRGITPVTILQSYRQGVKAWGEVGMDAMWSASTKKLIGAGLDDPKFAADIATLVGRHEVERASYSKSKDGDTRSWNEHLEQIREASQIRAMGKGKALLLATGAPVAEVALRPWYAEKNMAHIGAQMSAEEAAITKRAVGAYELRKARRHDR